MRSRKPPAGRAAIGALTVLAAGALLVGPAAHPASAQGEGDKSPQVELILDSSGSMDENDAGGQTRMAAAKDAVHTVIDNAPEQVDMGLRFYGHSYPGENETKGCQDTELVVPIGSLDDKAAAKGAVDQLEPIGFTPIGTALEQAGQDFEGDGKRRIILVSDGEDTCAPPDPCEVAADLADQGIELAIDTVGFNVDGKAKKQLQCIAEATGGQYGDASDADELADQLDSMVKRAVQGYAATGEPVRGSRNGCDDAPVLEQGQYLDQLRYDEEVWYQTKVRPGQTLRFSFTSVLNGSVARASSVDMELSLPGPGEFGIGKVLGDNATVVGWTNHASVGVETMRFDWSMLDPGEPETRVCARLENRLDGDQEFPTEIRIDVLGEPLTYSDLPKDARSNVTRIDPPDDTSGADGSDRSDTTDQDGDSGGEQESEGKTRGSEQRRPDDQADIALSGSEGDGVGPSVGLAAGVAAVGLLVGGVAGSGLSRRRRAQ